MRPRVSGVPYNLGEVGWNVHVISILETCAVCSHLPLSASSAETGRMSIQAVQRERAIQLYRHGLKNLLSWAIRRDLFAEEVKTVCW